MDSTSSVVLGLFFTITFLVCAYGLYRDNVRSHAPRNHWFVGVLLGLAVLSSDLIFNARQIGSSHQTNLALHPNPFIEVGAGLMVACFAAWFYAGKHHTHRADSSS